MLWRECEQAVAEGRRRGVLTRDNGHLQTLAQRLIEKEVPEGKLRRRLAAGKAGGLPTRATA